MVFTAMLKRSNRPSNIAETVMPQPDQPGMDLEVDAKGRVPGFGPVHAFVRAMSEDPEARQSPAARRLHRALLDNASVCSFCGVGCPYSVVPDAKGRHRIVPLSPLGLCVKGETSLQTGGDAERVKRLKRRGLPDDRIRTPMIRDHDGGMKPVSWDEALDRAAWLFLHTREWVGPHTAAIYGNGQKTIEAIWMGSLYKLVFGMTTIGANSEHCLASAGSAHEQNFGNEASFTWREFDELEHCDVVVMHGTNPLVTFPQAYEKALANERAVKVVIDPVRNDSAIDLLARDPRTLHIRFEQGGDILFNLAVAREILDQGWEDREYLATAVDPESMDAFVALCREDRCHPDAVARRIALAEDDPDGLADTIRRYAALIARPGPDGERPRPAFVSSMGINQSTGTFGFSSNLNLLLLTGNVGRRGAGSMRIAGQSNATSELALGFNSRRLVFNLDPADPAHRHRLADALDLPPESIPATKGTAVAHMADDDHLYCFIFVGTQMTRNMPRLGHWQRRMGRAFNIVIDSFLADGVLEHADVLLPSLTYTERTGVIQRGDRSLQLQQRVTEPPALAWSDEQILARLALAIAKRLRDPATAALNGLDPDVVARTFARYVDAAGHVNPAGVFDHVVEISRRLDNYNRFETASGEPISHALLRANAGRGVQWQGDGRYAGAREQGAVFPRVTRDNHKQARLVLPPEALLQRLVNRSEPVRGDCRDATPGAGVLANLITGRGRPGRRGKYYRGRYNSGIKTLPLTGAEDDVYWLELNPALATRLGVQENDQVRLTSRHGMAFAQAALNEHVPRDYPFLDFVPGQINRLTDYLDQDRFTNQSLIKRTPVRLTPLHPAEAALLAAPDRDALAGTVHALHAHYLSVYPTDAGWEALQRGEADAVNWLPPALLYQPQTPGEQAIASHVGAMAAFLQRYGTDKGYRADAGEVLLGLDKATKQAFMQCLLPLLRRLDYHDCLLDLLGDMVGPLRVADADGTGHRLTLKRAHQAAILEFKEEVVAAQVFIAVKRGLEILYGPHAVVPRDDLAFVSGIAIPCAADVPAYVMGIPPSALDARRVIHSRAIGIHAVLIVDRRRGRAVKMDIHTGVLPKDQELRHLRSAVIVKKRAASPAQHRRFFDRLGELIVNFARVGDGNYRVTGPMDLPWDEYAEKLAFVPALREDFQRHLLHVRPTPQLLEALLALGMLDAGRDAALVAQLHASAADDSARGMPAAGSGPGPGLPDLGDLPLGDRVGRVIDAYIRPTLENDGGRIELIDVDEPSGAVSIRFVGSCANCPYSMLTLENLVKPTLLKVPGVTSIAHRGFIRDGEAARIGEVRSDPPAPRAPAAPSEVRVPLSRLRRPAAHGMPAPTAR
jgi:anaerobic selenocysteine-containing dehydrogenase/Fe-S cluster biogenesis protein NfuA